MKTACEPRLSGTSQRLSEPSPGPRKQLTDTPMTKYQGRYGYRQFRQAMQRLQEESKKTKKSNESRSL